MFFKELCMHICQCDWVNAALVQSALSSQYDLGKNYSI